MAATVQVNVAAVSCWLIVCNQPISFLLLFFSLSSGLCEPLQRDYAISCVFTKAQLIALEEQESVELRRAIKCSGASCSAGRPSACESIHSSQARLQVARRVLFSIFMDAAPVGHKTMLRMNIQLIFRGPTGNNSRAARIAIEEPLLFQSGYLPENESTALIFGRELAKQLSLWPTAFRAASPGGGIFRAANSRFA